MKSLTLTLLKTICLMAFILPVTNVKADDSFTTVIGSNESHITVTGDLNPQPTEESEIVEDKDEEIEKEQKVIVPVADLPQTGEKANLLKYVGIGYAMLLLATLLYLKKNIRKKV